MILFEKYNKSVIDNKIYDTVMLADIVELNKENYFILSGYLFDNKDFENGVILDKEYKEDTFFKRNMQDEKSDIDAYYIIYNIDKKEVVKNKKQFIQDNTLSKNIRLDKTKCDKILIGGETAYKLKTNKSEYVFIDVKDNSNSYLIMKNTNNGLYPENMIRFNKENTKAEITDDIKSLQEMVKELENVNLLKCGNSAIKFIDSIVKETNEEEDFV